MSINQAPGQAAPTGLPNMLSTQKGATPPPQVGQLSQMPVDQLKQMFFQTMQGGSTVPPLSILAAIKQASERQRMQQAVMGQAAQQQAAQQPPTVRDEVLAQARGGIQALASGGPVQSFADGGAPWYMRGSKDYDDARRFGIDLSPYDSPAERAEKFRQLEAMREFESAPKGEIPTAPTMGQRVRPPAYPADDSRPGPQALERAVRTAPAGITAAAAPGPRPGTHPATAAPAAGGIAAVAQPDKLSEIEKEYEAANRGLQALLQKQGEVDPELARLRQASYESAQGIATRRERDRLAELEAAQKASRAPLLQNQEALLRLAAAASGKKRVGEALGAAAGAAGEVRGEQRKALEAAKKMSREEQNAIDQLNQALAEKRVADRSGDVDRQRQAALAVEQAKANLADKRLGVQTQRATEADRAEQRKIAREQIAAELQKARIAASARESASGMAEQRLAIQAMRADPSYAGIVKELTDAKKLAGVSNSPTFKARVQAAEDAARRLAAAYGVTPEGMGLGFGAEPAPTATASSKVIDFSSIK